jgi:hypothetical protein
MLAKATEESGAPFLKGELVDHDGRFLWAAVVAEDSESAAFRRWVNSLPATGNDALMQLRQYGFTYELARLEDQLRRALLHGFAGSLARIVGQRLLALLATCPSAACLLVGEERAAAADRPAFPFSSAQKWDTTARPARL